MSRHPYVGSSAERAWKTGVEAMHPLSPRGLYRKRFEIGPETRIATAGSCFAQHVARNMRARGFSVLDAEPAPPLMSPMTAQKYQYGVFSARYGNIYVTRQLLQLVAQAFRKTQPHFEAWERDGRYYDALRPSVEPEGLGSEEEVAAHRRQHLTAVAGMFVRTDVFVFTLGLTEAWRDRASGIVYPTAPGVIAGSFDPDRTEFVNFTVKDVLADLMHTRNYLKRFRPDMRFLLTVSPVPLTMTASDNHVLTASIYSKSVLRAAAGQFCEEFEDAAYFPSYEIIASHVSRGMFYEGNLRTVASRGVDTVMDLFFAEHRPPEPVRRTAVDLPDPNCEDALLEAFA